MTIYCTQKDGFDLPEREAVLETVTCNKCGGTGMNLKSEKRKCANCDGSGEVLDFLPEWEAGE